MPKLGPISRSEFVRKLKMFGFDGPFAGGKHQYMVKDDIRLAVPNPHRGDIGPDLLVRILRQAEISREEWLGKE